MLQAIKLTNGVPTLTWSAAAGQTYQPQYSASLTQAGWKTPPGMLKSIVATNGTMTITDTNAANSSQRLYRVVLIP